MGALINADRRESSHCYWIQTEIKFVSRKEVTALK